MTSKEQARKEPTLADLEAFERLLRDSLAKDQPSLAAPANTRAAAASGSAANDSAPPPADALAELARMIEAPLNFGLPPMPAMPSRPAKPASEEPSPDALALPAPEAAIETAPLPAFEAEPLSTAEVQPLVVEAVAADMVERAAGEGSGDPRDDETLFLGVDSETLAGPPAASTVTVMHETPELAGENGRAPIVLPIAQKAKEPDVDPLAAFEEELRRFDLRLAAQPVLPPPGTAAADGRQAPGWDDAGATVLAPQRPKDAVASPELAAAPAMSDPLERHEERLAAETAALAAATRRDEGGARRSKGVFFALGGIALAGLAAIGATFAFSERPVQVAGAGGVPVIAARPEPAKEKPVNPGGVEIPNQNKQVLATRDSRPDSGPAQVTNAPEQPLDLREVARREPVRVIAPSPFQTQAPGGTPAAPGAETPSAASPSEIAPEARRVQSVRLGDPIVPSPATPAIPPAGTASVAAGSAAIAALAGAAVASRASAPAASTPVAAPTPPAPSAAVVPPPTVQPPRPAATTPPSPPTTVAALPPSNAAPAPPKVESRPETVSTPTSPSVTARTTPAVPRPPRDPASQPVPRTANAPLELAPPRSTAAPTTRPANAGGSFAVQLASRPSQDDAQSASAELRARFSGALGGRGITVVSGTANGQTVYRVRAVGFASLAEANAACNRIKAAGGNCFPTRQ